MYLAYHSRNLFLSNSICSSSHTPHLLGIWVITFPSGAFKWLLCVFFPPHCCKRSLSSGVHSNLSYPCSDIAGLCCHINLCNIRLSLAISRRILLWMWLSWCISEIHPLRATACLQMRGCTWSDGEKSWEMSQGNWCPANKAPRFMCK